MIQEKFLDLIGYPNYKINILGEIYRFRFNRCGLTEQLYKEINTNYSNNYTQLQLCEKYNISLSYISLLLRNKRKN